MTTETTTITWSTWAVAHAFETDPAERREARTWETAWGTSRDVRSMCGRVTIADWHIDATADGRIPADGSKRTCAGCIAAMGAK